MFLCVKQEIGFVWTSITNNLLYNWNQAPSSLVKSCDRSTARTSVYLEGAESKCRWTEEQIIRTYCIICQGSSYGGLVTAEERSWEQMVRKAVSRTVVSCITISILDEHLGEVLFLKEVCFCQEMQREIGTRKFMSNFELYPTLLYRIFRDDLFSDTKHIFFYKGPQT